MRRLVAYGNSLSVNIPRPFVHALGLKRGDDLVVTVEQGGIMIRGLDRVLREREAPEPVATPDTSLFVSSAR